MSAPASSPPFSFREFTYAGLILVLFCLPVYFNNYRLLVLNAVPADAYQLQVRYWAGDYDETALVSPTSYRILLPVVAVPIYRLLPAVPLSRMPPDLDRRYARAVQAITLVGWIGTVLSLLTTLVLIRWEGLPRWSAWLVVVLAYYLLHFMFIFGVDPWSVAWLNLILLSRRRAPFVALCLLGVLLNEKIGFALFFLYSARWLFSSARPDAVRSLGVLLSVVGYFGVRWLFPLGGYERMITVADYPQNILDALGYLISANGLYQNVYPMVLIGSLYAVCRANNCLHDRLIDTKQSIFIILGMLALGLFLNVEYGIGRMTLYALPFLIVPLARLLTQRLTPPPVVL